MITFAELTEIKPYKTEHWDKKAEVEIMFDKISGKYDFLNRLLSLGIDKSWRKKALKTLLPYPHDHILDIATGTGDLAFMAEAILKPVSITGVDLSQGMLEIAKKRLGGRKKTKSNIIFLKGDAEKLELASDTFDAAIVAFGVRNFGDLQAGLCEINRVLKPGGKLMVLEFTKPRIFPFRQLFHIYFRNVLPLIGAFTSGDKKAYKYLFESVQAFPDFELFNQELTRAGFEKPKYQSLSAGICAIYLASKP